MIPIFFAPIQGVTDTIFRFAHSFFYGGVARYFTPFVRLEGGLLRKQDVKQLMLSKDLQLNNSSLSVQIIASDAYETKVLLDFLSANDFDEVDINFGCPFILQTKKFRGAGILPFPDRVGEIVEVLKCYKSMRFSIKMRLGMYSSAECLDLLDILNGTDLEFVTVHPRIGSQNYSWAVDLDMFEKFASKLQHPVVYNGDIQFVEDITKITNRFGFISAVMIGRGMLNNICYRTDCISSNKFETDNFSKNFVEFYMCLRNNYSNLFVDNPKQVENKLLSFWDYILPNLPKNKRKKISQIFV